MKYYIIDGSGFLFRAYHAFPTLIHNNGKNVNVLYGFFRMISKLFMENPKYFVITWDLPVPTKRHEIDSTYKANRPSIPDDFRHQIPLVHKTVEMLGIPNIGVPGYEADDIIATLAKKFESKCDVVVISSDKDLKQLLTSKIVVKDPMKNITTTAHSFEKEFNFTPQYMLDYLSLIGDAADNIKGVPGIGPKGAGTLIKKYHTIENIYDHIDEISGTIQKKLIDGKDSAFHSKKMIELLDIDILHSHVLEDYRLDLDIGRFRQILVNEYHFDTMNKVLDELHKKLTSPTQNSLF